MIDNKPTSELRGAIAHIIKLMSDGKSNIKLKAIDFFGSKRGEAIERFSSPKEFEDKIASGAHGPGVNVVHCSFFSIELALNKLYQSLIQAVKTTDDEEESAEEVKDQKYNPYDDLTFYGTLTDVIVKSANITKPEFNRNILVSQMVQKAPPEINLPDAMRPTPQILTDDDGRFDNNDTK